MDHRLALAVPEIEPARAAERPVFILGCSWRCGSTLLQRYINSTGDVFVWGENAGMVGKLIDAFEPIRGWEAFQGVQRADYEKLGHNAWIANLNPVGEKLSDALRAFLAAYYATPELERRGVRWGFKEVQHDASVAQMLLGAFPDARIVFLTRRLDGVLASVGSADWRGNIGGVKGARRQWADALASFHCLKDERVLRLRYEDLIGDPRAATRRLGEHLDIPAGRFDPRVLETKVRGHVGRPKLRLQAKLELRRPEVRRLMESYDYA